MTEFEMLLALLAMAPTGAFVLFGVIVLTEKILTWRNHD